MSTVSDTQGWIAERSAKDRRLYERFGRPLESEHTGQFVAISDEGQVILETDLLTVLDEALDRFGPYSHAIRRIGYDAVLRLRALDS